MPAAQSSKKAAAKPKSRSVVPIPSTIESIRGYPEKLIIFKVPASPFWWVRYYDGKPIKRSTQTDNKQEAIRFAKTFYESVVVNNALGRSNNGKIKSFMLCANAVIKEDEEKAKRGELSERYAKTQRTLINKHVKAFFKAYEIGDVNYAILDKFKTYLFGLNMAAASVKMHFVAVKKIFNHAQRHSIIKVAPLLPDVKLEDNPRGYFNLQEYKRLRRTTRKLVGAVAKIKQRKGGDDEEAAKVLRNVVVTREFQLLVPFMIYTFIRPTDLKQIQHRHIEIRQGEEGEYLWMPLPKSKRHDSPITSMPRAAVFYKQLKAIALADKAKSTGLPVAKVDVSDDYVFSPQHANRDYAYAQIYRQFELVLETADMKHSGKGDVFTPYSLRHTSIMYRLIYGGEINTTKIAKNARTSTEIIERFYVAQLESSDVTRDLHKRKQPRIKRESKTFMAHAGTSDLNEVLKREAEKIPASIRNKTVKIS